MKRTRVKICGITRQEDARVSVDAGADALGFVFYPPSPRYVEPEAAADIIKSVPAFVTTTALFVNEDRDAIDRVINLTRIDLLQFHGDESEEFCNSFSRPYIKALRMKPDMDVQEACKAYPSARAILLDAYRPGIPGGTGEVFDWGLIPQQLPIPLILAGGLSCENIAKAVQTVSPFAVDVSGGVELSKGIKDVAKVETFVHEVNRAN